MSNKSGKNLQSFYRKVKNSREDVRNKNLYKLVSKRVTGKKVLDIGSGSGNFLSVLQDMGFEVEGIEPDKELIKLSKQLKNYPKTHNLTAEKVDSLKEKFDTITMIDVLEHIEDDTVVLKKIRKILKPKSRLIIVVPAFQSLYNNRDKKIGHYRRYNIRDLKKKLKLAGYTIEESRYWNMVGFFVYLLLGKVLGKEATGATFRDTGKKNVFKRTVRKLLGLYIEKIENNINLGFGLSAVCVARK